MALTPSVCEEKVRLSDAVWSVVREIVELNDRRIDSLNPDSPGLEGYSRAKKLAIQRHDDAKRALLLHTWNHGC
jgi:hypothetical protein